ncbi:MAG: hypothetical protein IPO08_20090 [Xanthomonadales bacterium]|nr:hypothetical protein [Xanthomonadales bacterium]
MKLMVEVVVNVAAFDDEGVDFDLATRSASMEFETGRPILGEQLESMQFMLENVGNVAKQAAMNAWHASATLMREGAVTELIPGENILAQAPVEGVLDPPAFEGVVPLVGGGDEPN